MGYDQGALQSLEDYVERIRNALSLAEARIAALEGNQWQQWSGGGGGFPGSNKTGLTYALTGGGGLSPAAGLTLGGGTVTLYATSAGGTLTLLATTANCFSGSTATVGAGGALIGMSKRDDGSGDYDCVAEFC